MMRKSLLLALATLWLVGPARAQLEEPAAKQAEFVQNLRVKGLHSLAFEYLDRLEAMKDAEINAMLPLERARTIVSMARDKEAEQRFGLFEQARGELLKYVKSNANNPNGAMGQLELARLSAYHGQALLTKALREEEPAESHKLARPAEAKFVQAAGDLTAAIAAIQKVLGDSKLDPAKKEMFEKELLQAKFDQGSNIIDQARTYIDTGKDKVLRDRALKVDAARKVFEELAKDEGGVGLLASAWLMKVAMEQTSPDAVLKYKKRVELATGAEARPAQKWVRLFYMQDLLKSPTYQKIPVAKRVGMIESEAKQWISTYRTTEDTKSPEGQGVLWELANAYYNQAQLSQGPPPKKGAPPPLTKKSIDYYQQAIGTLDRLATIDGDYSEKASQMSLAIQFLLMENTKRDLRTFEDWFLKARFEMYQLRKLGASDEDKEGPKYEAKRKGHLKAIIHAFQNALANADIKTPLQKIDDARYYLAGAYRVEGDLYRAAVMGESIGRVRPPTRRAGASAAYAIDAYSALGESDETAKLRLVEMCEFVLTPDSQKFWSADPVTNLARYHSAMIAQRDDKFAESVKLLEGITSDFNGFTLAMGQLAFIAREGMAKTEDEKIRESLKQAAIRALDRMPPLASDADTTTANMYFRSKLELPRYQFSDAAALMMKNDNDKAKAKYDEMGKAIATLQQEFKTYPQKLSQKNHDDIAFSLQVFQKYVNLGEANLMYRQSKIEEALAAVKPTLDAVSKLDKGAEIRMKDHELTGDVLGLALRVLIQKGDSENAKKTLDQIKRLRSEEDNAFQGDETAKALGRVIQELTGQIEQLRDAKKDQELKTLVGNFGSFLDEMAKEFVAQGFKTKGKFDLNGVRMLAGSYKAIDNPEKAAEILSQVQPPAVLKKDPKAQLTDEERTDLGTYWFLRLEYARAVRSSKKNLDAGMKAMNELLNHPMGAFQFHAEFERNLILEEQGHLAPAIKQWQKFISNPALRRAIANNNDLKKLYFEGMYNNTRCFYKYGKTDPKASSDAKTQQRFFDNAASQIVQMEFATTRDGWELVGDLYRALMTVEPSLREAYDRLKKARESK